MATMNGAPRAFVLQRDVDETGVSGTGIVAEGVLFSDGTVSLRWTSDWPTSVVFHDRGMESVEAVHGHGGKTRVVFSEPDRDAMKVAVCEYFLEVNRGFVAKSGSPLIAPTAIDWLGNGIVDAVSGA